MTLLERLTAPGPKRILALDGGGVRGTITLAFLAAIEDLLRARYADPDFRLADYFDLIGGTSVGAILAAYLALGHDIATIRTIFSPMIARAFGRPHRVRLERARYDRGPLEQVLREAFGDVALGDASIRTGLCIVTKRADTGSTWPLLNHPSGQYFAHNRSILLRDALRASAAAPTYFEPERLRVKDDEYGVFVDGGVSSANNPAFQLFLVGTLKGFCFNWPSGEDRLLLVSLGTGSWRRADQASRVLSRRVWNWAREVPGMLIEDASLLNQTFLQLVSRSPTATRINDEIGDLASDLLTPVPALSYLRYDVRLDAEGLTALALPELVPVQAQVRDMSAITSLASLERIGQRAAEQQIKAEHFRHVFDPT